MQNPPQPITILPPITGKLAETQTQTTPGQATAGTGAESQAVPSTKAEYEALLKRKSSLSDQLESAQHRRDLVARQLRSATGVSQAGLETRLVVLDGRLVQLEREISTNSSLLAQAPARIAAMSRMPGNFMGNIDVTAISVVFTLFVLAPISFTLARNLWRRGNRAPTPLPSPQNDARMERVEQSVDAIAIEIERITEGQRFITQLLSKAQTVPALGVGQAPAEPIRVANMDAVPVLVESRRG